MAHNPLVVALGEILWDLLPAGKQMGGAPANFAFHAQQFGARAITASAVGDDALGREILARLADLGLEFLHWPEQRLVKNEMRRGRSCKVLESTNPQPGKGAYSRVRSWIDSESAQLIRAEAYDSENRLLKEFSVGSVKKVRGRWELKDMEIRNEQTDSLTRLEFDLDEN